MDAKQSGEGSLLELWGGAECSHIRVRDRIENQLARTGHDRRQEDLEQFAALGLQALRQPVLWEQHCGPDADWRGAESRLRRLRELGLRPIVGFVHHGSGPLPGGLLDPGFVEGLARYAGEFARRFPWVEDYTPVNEPLTTARFGGLYGVWHPHTRDLESFVRALLHQCAGVRAAMRAVREVNPRARLVQTEDVGKTHGTPLLRYQADLENERRWLSFDPLSGRLRPGSRMWNFLRAGGASPAELESFLRDPCPPDLLGMNHYVTSERYLDESLDHYPAEYHGGNNIHRYADVPAVRARVEGLCGWRGLLGELWSRYRISVAITEVQLACTREEQVRWLLEAWREAHAARAEGVDVRALTVWALLGAYDWDSLLTRRRGAYESGAFDVRGPAPRPTALAKAVRSLARRGEYAHPAVDASPGWWRRGLRLEFGPARRRGCDPVSARPGVRPLLVLGAGGGLGRAFGRLCHLRGLPVVACRRAELDLTDGEALREMLARVRPWAVVNAAGYVRLNEAGGDAAHCFRVNTHGPAALAAACAERGIALAVFSSHLVFDGGVRRPCLESDTTGPLSVYGLSKALMERGVAERHPGALIVRSSAFFSPWDEANFAVKVLRGLRRGETVNAAMDVHIAPTYVPDLANTTLDLLIDGERGLWHLANTGAVSWADWGRAVADLAGLPGEQVVGVPADELGWRAVRPAWSVLGSERGALLRDWRSALRLWFRDVVAHAPADARALHEAEASVR